MRLVIVVLYAAVLFGSGCHVGYKSAAGGATSPDGFGKGVTRSLQFADEGLLLSRLGLGLIAGAAAVGSIESASIVKDSNGNLWQTASVNVKDAQSAQAVADMASSGKLSSKSGGLAARLQIAGQTLGGDTSGWQYDMGANIRTFKAVGPLATMLRAYVGVGYGSFTMHDRVLEAMDRGPPKFGTGDYTFLGLYGRGGAFLIANPGSFKDIKGLEVFGTVSLNASGPSIAGIGARVQATLLFAEVEVQTSSSSVEGQTYTLEVGLGL